MDFPQMYNLHETYDNIQDFSFGNLNGNRSTDQTQFASGGSVTSHYGAATSGVSHPRSSTAVSHNVDNILASATHHKLFGSGNQAYCTLYESFVGLKNRYAVQNEHLSELKGELTTLRRQILEQPTKSREEHSTSNSHSRTKAITGDIAVPSTPPALQREDYPDVPFWTKGEWDKLVERQKLANKSPSWNAFLTDEDGHALSKQRYNEIWADAKLAFNSLYYRRVDPTSWSKKTDIAAAYFYNTMTAKYPEFQLCEGNWKVQHWATERYPDWVKNVRKPGGLKRAVPSIITTGQKRPAPPLQPATKASKKPRIISKGRNEPDTPHLQPPATKIATQDPITIDDESDEESIYAPKPKTTPSTESQVSSKHDVSETSSSTDNGCETSLRNPLPADPEPMAAPLSDPTLPQSTTLAVHVPQQLEERQVSTPEATFESQVDLVAPVSTTQSPTPPRLPTPSSVQASRPPEPSTALDTVTDSGPGVQQPQPVRPVRQQRMNPLANLVVPKAAIELPQTATRGCPPQTSDAMAKSVAVKKTKALVPSDTLLTPRWSNLYMRDYVKEHPKASLDDFRQAWTDLAKLDPGTLQAYETQSKSLKAAAKAALTSSVIVEPSA